jgi:hypothetical protein
LIATALRVPAVALVLARPAVAVVALAIRVDRPVQLIDRAAQTAATAWVLLLRTGGDRRQGEDGSER